MKPVTIFLSLVFVTLVTALPAAETYELRYKFKPDEVLQWKVVHLATTETRIQGNSQTSRSRSISVKRWTMKSVDADGNMTFVNSVPKIDMWQKVSDRPEVSYNSEKDADIPAQYQAAAKTVGVPISKITIAPHGKVVRRDSAANRVNLGLGEVTVPLPEEKVSVGHQWTVPGEVSCRLPSGLVQRVKTRQLYTLDKVRSQIATIKITTEVLTPINNPRVKSQLIQQLTNGWVRFDIERGRIHSRQTDWDETVIGFGGPNSLMKYLARFTEELMDNRVAATEADADSPNLSARSTRDGEPALRR